LILEGEIDVAEKSVSVVSRDNLRVFLNYG